MGLATTIQNIRAMDTGFAIPTIFYVNQETMKPEPVVFKDAGQILDLTRVDIPSFVEGLKNTEIQSLLRSGTLMLIQVDVPEKIEQAIRNEQAKTTLVDVTTPRANHGHETAVVALEPGMYVAVGAGGNPQPTQPVVNEVIRAGANANVSTAVEVEPGLVVAPPVEKVTAKPAPKIEIPEAASWKDGLSFDKQVAYIRSSKDKNFLQSVIDDTTESLKLKRIAKETLANLNLS